MSYPIKYPTPQGANIQIFNVTSSLIQSWVKPQGASFVWFTLIGAGGGGGGSDGASGTGGGGGSGAVTNCMVPAFLIPDSLQIKVGKGGSGGVISGDGSGGAPANISYRANSTTGFTLLNANGGAGGLANGNGSGAGGTADSSNYFSCMGFFQSIAGQAGVTSGTISPSSTTFLGGGAGTSASDSASANYGYSTGNYGSGYFQIQPIIVGVGGGLGSGTGGNVGGIGCGGGGTDLSPVKGGNGGNGLVVIITW
jgi:hypothetical protein